MLINIMGSGGEGPLSNLSATSPACFFRAEVWFPEKVTSEVNDGSLS